MKWSQGDEGSPRADHGNQDLSNSRSEPVTRDVRSNAAGSEWNVPCTTAERTAQTSKSVTQGHQSVIALILFSFWLERGALNPFTHKVEKYPLPIFESEKYKWGSENW